MGVCAGMGYTLDTNMNTALYGPDVTPQAILSGGLQPPEGMKELYAALDHVRTPGWRARCPPSCAVTLAVLQRMLPLCAGGWWLAALQRKCCLGQGGPHGALQQRRP